MLNNADYRPRKRVLSKINRHSLIKAPQEEEEQETIEDPPSFYLNPKKIFMLSSCLCLAEDNRKIYVDTSYLNSYFNTSNIILQDKFYNKVVDVRLQVNAANTPLDYTIERLESYGSLELAMWAQRMKKYFLGYKKVMTNYYDLVDSQDPNMMAAMEKSQIDARLACKEIESQYSYKKLQAFSTLEGTEMLLSSYSEGFLEEMGYTVQEFMETVRGNGLPELFNKDCTVHLDIAKRFLDGTTLSSGSIQDWSEYFTTIKDKTGKKKEVKFHFVNILEPRPEGILTTGYFVLNPKDTEGFLSLSNTKLMATGNLIYHQLKGSTQSLKQLKCEQDCI